MPPRERGIAVCCCGCGTTWERGGRGQRVRLYAPQCTTRHPDDGNTRVPCGCGQCGLTFIRGYKRKFAAACPTRANREAEEKAKRHAARLAKRDAARAAAGLPKLKQGHGPKTGKRCRTCEGLPHRRPLWGCDCGQPYAPEPELRAQATLSSSAGMALTP